MAKGYSKDLRARAVALVEDGESRREAARVLGVGASTAIRWIERWATTGSVAALPGTGHSRSPLEAHRQWLLDLVAAEPDLTLEEIRARLKSEKRLNDATGLVGPIRKHDDVIAIVPERIGLSGVDDDRCIDPELLLLTGRVAMVPIGSRLLDLESMSPALSRSRSPAICRVRRPFPAGR